MKKGFNVSSSLEKIIELIVKFIIWLRIFWYRESKNFLFHLSIAFDSGFPRLHIKTHDSFLEDLKTEFKEISLTKTRRELIEYALAHSSGAHFIIFTIPNTDDQKFVQLSTSFKGYILDFPSTKHNPHLRAFPLVEQILKARNFTETKTDVFDHPEVPLQYFHNTNNKIQAIDAAFGKDTILAAEVAEAILTQVFGSSEMVEISLG